MHIFSLICLWFKESISYTTF